MNFKSSAYKWPHLLWSMLMLAIAPAYAVDAASPAPDDKNVIISTEPMEIEADSVAGAHGQLVVDLDILSDETGNDLVYIITVEPLHGKVGLAGIDEDADEFETKTSRIGYFSYQPEAEYTGSDSFAYIVRNELSGLSFKNKAVITVMPPAPIMLDKLEVEASHLRFLNVQGVALTTRPNTPVSKKVPSHEDFMSAEDRVDLAQSKVSYVLDDQAMAKHGSAKLDRVTGQLTYSPDPGFIGVDEFSYYTVDENNPQLGVENAIVVNIEPIRISKQVTADRSRSCEVDLLFVINNSPSMAAHQQRIATNLSRFRKLFDQRDLDYRIGVVTTDFINRDRNVARDEQNFYKKVYYTQLDGKGQPILNFWGRPKKFTKQVASNGNLVTLPDMAQPWATPETFDYVFFELVKVGTNGDSNRTAFTAVYNFVANYQNKKHAFLRPDATTIVVFFMDEEETRMAAWKKTNDSSRQATWIQNGKLPDLIDQYNKKHPHSRQTLTGYLNYWVLRPFIIVKGNKRGKLEINAVVSSDNISHRRAAELTGGTVLNINSDFSAPLAALGDRIANTVAVALDPVAIGASFYQKSLHVLVDGQEVKADPTNGYVYDPRNHSIRFEGTAKKKAFLAKIAITYEEHM